LCKTIIGPYWIYHAFRFLLCCNKLYDDRYTKGVRGPNECKHPLCSTAQLARSRRLYAEIADKLEKWLDEDEDMQGVFGSFTEQSHASH
jgi:hypothetical protein